MNAIAQKWRQVVEGDIPPEWERRRYPDNPAGFEITFPDKRGVSAIWGRSTGGWQDSCFEVALVDECGHLLARAFTGWDTTVRGGVTPDEFVRITLDWLRDRTPAEVQHIEAERQRVRTLALEKHSRAGAVVGAALALAGYLAIALI